MELPTDTDIWLSGVSVAVLIVGGVTKLLSSLVKEEVRASKKRIEALEENTVKKDDFHQMVRDIKSLLNTGDNRMGRVENDIKEILRTMPRDK